jgi:hypothetical protein
MVPLRFRPTDLVDFWLMPWSAPFRAACCWIALLGAPLCGSKPDEDAPAWLRPLCLQRWVGKAIAARLLWLREHPDAPPYRFEPESEPCWTEAAAAHCDRRDLREHDEAALLGRFGVEVERLLRVAQEAPRLVGGGDWTCAALGAQACIAQLYAELKRRPSQEGQRQPGGRQWKATRARALLRAELRRFAEGDGCVAMERAAQGDGHVCSGAGG